MELLKLILDLTIIALLGGGIYYAIRLERQLAALRESRADMQRHTQDFAVNVARAETGIKSLKLISRETGDDLEKILEQSRKMRDELLFVIDRADKLAARVSAAPQRHDPAPPRPVGPTLNPAADASGPKSRAERELMLALQKIGGGNA